jgi:hypothetical protein
MENIFYYLALFLLVFIIRYFKLKKDYKQNFSENWPKLFHVSLELIYTASGIVIALILNIEKIYIPVVIISYIILVITSSLLEMANEQDFKPNFITWFHGSLVVCIIFVSIITYSKIIPNVDINGEAKKDVFVTKPKYAIIIPYSDESLQRHVGNKELKERKFLFYNEISGYSVDSIRKVSLTNLKHSINPLFSKNKVLDISIYEDDIKVIRIDKNSN